MGQFEDLSQAVQAEDVELQDLVVSIKKVDDDLIALKAKVLAGGMTPEQIATVLGAIQSHTALVKTGSQQLKDADTSANA